MTKVSGTNILQQIIGLHKHNKAICKTGSTTSQFKYMLEGRVRMSLVVALQGPVISAQTPNQTTNTGLTNHVKHEVPYQEAQRHSTAKYESSR